MLIRNRNFGLLWGGESISLLGSEVSTIALPSLAVLAFGAGTLSVGSLVALQWIPFVLLAPIMGVFTDRWRRLPLMMIANVARVIILGSLPLAAVLGHLTITQVYIVALLKGIFDVVFQLAYQAYMLQILAREDLAEGNAATQMSRSIAQVAGRSIGGGLVGLVGAAKAIGIDAASYLVAAITLGLIKHKEPAPKPADRGLAATLRELKAGAVITFGNRLLRSLALMATFGNMAVSLTLTMIIVYAYKNLGLSASQLGLALGIGSVAVIAGALLSRKINAKLGMGRTVVLTHSLLAVAFLLLPLATLGNKTFAFVIIAISQGLSAATTPVANVGGMTMIQMATPPEAMGRVAGVSLPFVWGANAVGPILGGAVAVWIGTQNVFFLSAALALLAVVVIYIGGVHLIRNEVPEEYRAKV
ncbi:MFS transporter [Nocardia colli]|uniref:MFS transporter n=1 Tax=Nocardia colli TaxID=2545717 RepID=UPI001CC362A7|nr:MFS transporter [Nocardia colli]